MSKYQSEKETKNHPSFCKHHRSSVKREPFVFSEKTLKTVSEKADRFDEAISLAAQVSKTNLENSVRKLAAFHTRHTKSATLSQVTDWIIGQFQAIGYTDTFLHSYIYQGLNVNNVVCRKPSQSGQTETIILCGHFDSLNKNDSDNSTIRAPGANDNATGVAVILETARLLFATSLDYAIEFVCFSGEEQGYKGAEAYVAKVTQDNLNLKFLLNLDQIGFPSASKEVVIEHDGGNKTAINDAASKLLAETLANLAENRLGIDTESQTIERSDYMPFESRGYTVIGLYESGNYGYIAHTSQDTPEKIDYDYLVNMTKVTVAAMFI